MNPGRRTRSGWDSCLSVSVLPVPSVAIRRLLYSVLAPDSRVVYAQFASRSSFRLCLCCAWSRNVSFVARKQVEIHLPLWSARHLDASLATRRNGTKKREVGSRLEEGSVVGEQFVLGVKKEQPALCDKTAKDGPPGFIDRNATRRLVLLVRLPCASVPVRALRLRWLRSLPAGPGLPLLPTLERAGRCGSTPCRCRRG
jgi:hypothetical protein